MLYTQHTEFAKSNAVSHPWAALAVSLHCKFIVHVTFSQLIQSSSFKPLLQGILLSLLCMWSMGRVYLLFPLFSSFSPRTMAQPGPALSPTWSSSQAAAQAAAMAGKASHLPLPLWGWCLSVVSSIKPPSQHLSPSLQRFEVSSDLSWFWLAWQKPLPWIKNTFCLFRTQRIFDLLKEELSDIIFSL